MAATYHYTAETSTPARQQGTVMASGISWSCQGNRCMTSGPWPVPAVGACQALAKQVGPIRRYGHKGRQLSPGELSQCSAGLSSSPPAGGATTLTQHPSSTGAGTPTGISIVRNDTRSPNTLPVRGPTIISTPTLRYIGRGDVQVTTATLHYVGRGDVQLTTETLRYVGRGSVTIEAAALRYTGRGSVVVHTGTLTNTGTVR